MNQRLDQYYGRYRLIAGVIDKRPRAIAYLGESLVVRTEAESVGEAISDLMNKIDLYEQERMALRVDEVPHAIGHLEKSGDFAAVR